MSSESDPKPSESPARDKLAGAASEMMDGVRESPQERSLWKGGYSPKAMYGTWILTGIATVAILIGGFLFAKGDNQSTVWMILGGLILVGWTIAIGTFLYRRVSMHYELTTQRFLHQAGILMRTTDRIEVIDIDDVSFSQGIIQRMLGVGKITITGSDRTHPKLVLQGIDKVPEIATLIDDVRREERRRRSLHIESI